MLSKVINVVVPQRARQRLRRLKRHRILTRIDLWLARAAVKIPIGESIYYLFLSRAFRREHRAVLWGRLKHQEGVLKSGRNPYLLRRNVHRLEKGLIMRPRREVFAAGYIEETVHCFAGECMAVAVGNGPPKDELRWAQDVLSSYFEAVGRHPAIERARARFTATCDATAADNGERLRPYQRDLTMGAPVTFDELHGLLYRRRSVRWFLPEPVPRELIDQAVQIALLSPSACNRQPYQFRIFDDPRLVRAVSSIPMGTQGFSHNFPAVVVLVGRQRAYFSERDRHVIYIDASLAAMSFVLALETLGLSSCCINWPDIEPEERRMAAQLSLEPDERPVMLIALGYPDPTGYVPYSQKRQLDEARRYN